MSAARWFVPRGTLAAPGDFITLPPAIAQQARTVLRLRNGDVVTLLDDSGDAWPVTLHEVARERVTGHLGTPYPVATEPTHHVILYQALIKAAKFEVVVQKGTEIGISSFVPLITARSVSGLEEASAQKIGRWRTIATEAAEQSERGHIPTISAPQSLATVLQALTATDSALIAWEEAQHAIAAPLTIHRALAYTEKSQPRKVGAIHLFIGPEGGFTAEEIALAQHHGGQIVTLGPRILRAETAAIVAATLTLSALGDIG